jgi:hypothetical protein
MRRQPVAFFLGDAAFLSDAKFRQLARRLTDPDDFNSAVGAFFIALAAARRNGLPELDVAGETLSRFVDDLVAVGLLGPDGFPDKAFRSWAPGRPKFPSDQRAPVAPSAPNGSESYEHSASVPVAPSLLPSLPIPSIPETTARDGLPNLNSTVASEWEKATGRSVLASGDKAAAYLDDACSRHPAYEVAAAIVRARKQFDHVPEVRAMHGALLKVLDPFVDSKKAGELERERERQAASRRGTESTLRRNHEVGGHYDAPHALCPACKEAEVTA